VSRVNRPAQEELGGGRCTLITSCAVRLRISEALHVVLSGRTQDLAESSLRRDARLALPTSITRASSRLVSFLLTEPCHDALAGMVGHLSSLWLCIVSPAHPSVTKQLNEETIV
jgi:hypothetical protein